MSHRRARPRVLHSIHYSWRLNDFNEVEFALKNEHGVADESTWHVADRRHFPKQQIEDVRARLIGEQQGKRSRLLGWMFG